MSNRLENYKLQTAMRARHHSQRGLALAARTPRLHAAAQKTRAASQRVVRRRSFAGVRTQPLRAPVFSWRASLRCSYSRCETFCAFFAPFRRREKEHIRRASIRVHKARTKERTNAQTNKPQHRCLLQPRPPRSRTGALACCAAAQRHKALTIGGGGPRATRGCASPAADAH
jgi:hypothetical protein